MSNDFIEFEVSERVARINKILIIPAIAICLPILAFSTFMLITRQNNEFVGFLSSASLAYILLVLVIVFLLSSASTLSRHTDKQLLKTMAIVFPIVFGGTIIFILFLLWILGVL